MSFALQVVPITNDFTIGGHCNVCLISHINWHPLTNVMYRNRNIFKYLSPTIQSITWHPFISFVISWRLCQVDTSRSHDTCMQTHLDNVWHMSTFHDTRHHFTALMPCYTDISLPLNHSYIQYFQKFTQTEQCSSFGRATMADGYHSCNDAGGFKSKLNTHYFGVAYN